MENLQDLKNEKRQLELQLERMEIREYGSTPWAPGVTDQYDSHSYSHVRYTDETKAAKLKERIKYLDERIRTYAFRAQAERDRQEREMERRNPKYDYVAGGVSKTTTQESIAARYDAQHRFFGMSKLKQTMAKVTGQYSKFKKLWNKAGHQLSSEEDRKVAEELNGLFRSK